LFNAADEAPTADASWIYSNLISSKTCALLHFSSWGMMPPRLIPHCHSYIMPPHNFDDLRTAIRAFAQARDWEQFHTPKNLVMALSVESAELLEHFQWLTPEQSTRLDAQNKAEVAQEIGDVLIYLTRLADVLGVDPLQAAFDKIELNAVKYPVEKSKGNNTKYDKLQ